MVMDFASAARGYGLELAFLLGAMYAFAGRIGRGRFDPAAADWRKGCAAASVLLALAFAANLTNIIPALSLTLAFAIVVLPPGLLRSGTPSSGLRGFVQWTILPGAAAGLFLLAPLLMPIIWKSPVSRSCLYVIPLFTVSCLLLAKEFSARVRLPVLSIAGLLLAGLVLLDYASAIQARSFRYNAYDIISRDLYQAIEKDALSRGLTNARVGGTWWYEPEINFYRVRYKAKWRR